jgi:hypothetical protein
MAPAVRFAHNGFVARARFQSETRLYGRQALLPRSADFVEKVLATGRSL